MLVDKSFGPASVHHVLDHFLHIHPYLHEVLVQDAFPFFLRRECVEFGQRHIPGFLFLDFLHVEIGFAEELGGLELRCFLYVHAAVPSGLGLHEVTFHLSAYPPRRQVAYLRCWHEVVHVLVQVDAGLVPVDGNAFLQLHHLAEDVVAQPF